MLIEAPKSTVLAKPDLHGVTENRAVLGGYFIAMGIATLIFVSVEMYRMADLGCLTVSFVCLISMIIDKSLVRSNYISLPFELLFEVVLFCKLYKLI